MSKPSAKTLFSGKEISWRDIPEDLQRKIAENYREMEEYMWRRDE